MILITRPKEQSKSIEVSLNSKGYKTYLESLYKITYYKKKISYNKKNYYIFPSINSVQSLINSKQIHKFHEAKILAIGNKVKKALVKAGCKNIIIFSINSDALLREIIKSKFVNFNFVYLCSNIVNKDFLKKISQYKINLQNIIIYKTIPSSKLDKKLVHNLELGNINGAIFLSKLSVETFIRLISKSKCLSVAKKINMYCLSDRVAVPLKLKKFKYIYIATSPNESALVKSIKKSHFFN